MDVESSLIGLEKADTALKNNIKKSEGTNITGGQINFDTEAKVLSGTCMSLPFTVERRLVDGGESHGWHFEYSFMFQHLGKPFAVWSFYMAPDGYIRHAFDTKFKPAERIHFTSAEAPSLKSQLVGELCNALTKSPLLKPRPPAQ